MLPCREKNLPGMLMENPSCAWPLFKVTVRAVPWRLRETLSGPAALTFNGMSAPFVNAYSMNDSRSLCKNSVSAALQLVKQAKQHRRDADSQLPR